MVRSNRRLSQPAATSNVPTISRRPYHETVGPPPRCRRGTGCSRADTDAVEVMPRALLPRMSSRLCSFHCRERFNFLVQSSIKRHKDGSGATIDLDADQSCFLLRVPPPGSSAVRSYFQAASRAVPDAERKGVLKPLVDEEAEQVVPQGANEDRQPG